MSSRTHSSLRVTKTPVPVPACTRPTWGLVPGEEADGAHPNQNHHHYQQGEDGQQAAW